MKNPFEFHLISGALGRCNHWALVPNVNRTSFQISRSSWREHTPSGPHPVRKPTPGFSQRCWGRETYSCTWDVNRILKNIFFSLLFDVLLPIPEFLHHSNTCRLKLSQTPHGCGLSQSFPFTGEILDLRLWDQRMVELESIGELFQYNFLILQKIIDAEE